MRATEFEGFPREGVAFLTDLASHNRRVWFEARKQVYWEQVVQPAVRFIEAFGPRLARIEPTVRFDTRTDGRGSIFRIYRDTRFSADKSPYKTNLGMLFWLETGQKKTENPSFYVGIYPEGGRVYAGIRRLPPTLLKRYREAVAGSAGGALHKILRTLSDRGYDTGGPGLQRVPRGFDPEHQHADLLRRDEVHGMSPLIDLPTVTSAEFVEVCLRSCSDLAPLNRWLRDRVAGPAQA